MDVPPFYYDVRVRGNVISLGSCFNVSDNRYVASSVVVASYWYEPMVGSLPVNTTSIMLQVVMKMVTIHFPNYAGIVLVVINVSVNCYGVNSRWFISPLKVLASKD